MISPTQPDPDALLPDPEQAGQRRLLDAVGNRLEEAVRVVEDQLRFRYGLSAQPKAWREIRHEAATLRRAIGGGSPLALSRDVGSDPGHPQRAPSAGGHRDPADLLSANFARAREASRSLEEELRCVDPKAARLAERLRYRVSALESAALGQITRGPRLHDARLYVLVTTSLCRGAPEEVTQAALDGGAQIIQLREKEMEGREFLQLAERLRALTERAGALLIINDRVEIAHLIGADGVHLGQGDILPSAARRILGDRALIGLSTHAPEEAARAAIEGADYIGVGPIFETMTKEHRASVGPEYIAQAKAVTDLPGYAIGSVKRDNVDDLIAAGADRIAVCTGVISQDDVRASAKFFRDKLDAAAANSPEEP